MSDGSELSMQAHELNYILNKLGKRQTQSNRDKLKELERVFKTSIPRRTTSGNGLAMTTKSYTKDDFYNWLKIYVIIDGENQRKRTVTFLNNNFSKYMTAETGEKCPKGGIWYPIDCPESTRAIGVGNVMPPAPEGCSSTWVLKTATGDD
jgi:hypothetical protein